MEKRFILRARVIEGSIPKPTIFSSDKESDLLTDQNFEIIAKYDRNSFLQLLNIAKESLKTGSLSSFEILAWAGGANNHDGPRYLWHYQFDASTPEHIQEDILSAFDSVEPQDLPAAMKDTYSKTWQNMRYGFTLNSYLANAKEPRKPSLEDRIDTAKQGSSGKRDERAAEQIR